jgi:hypothetical protein
LQDTGPKGRSAYQNGLSSGFFLRLRPMANLEHTAAQSARSTNGVRAIFKSIERDATKIEDWRFLQSGV